MTDVEPDSFYLRPLEKDDIARITEWFYDLDDLSSFDRNMRMPLNSDASETMWNETLGATDSKRNYWFAIVQPGSPLVGIVGMETISFINGDAVVSLFIQRDFRRRGIGGRALALVLDVAFLQLGLKRITSFHRFDNAVSAALTERFGFRREGCMRRAWSARGRQHDMMVVGLLHDEWLERRQELAREMAPQPAMSFGPHASANWTWPPAASNGDV